MTDGAQPSGPKQYRYLDMVIGIFVTVLIASNIVSSKVGTLWGFTMGCGIFVFPIDYIFGDVLTEVYGYARSRRVIWIGFLAAALASLIFYVADVIPPAPGYTGQAAFHAVLGQLPRVVAASLVAYLFGEFCNSIVLAKMKVWSEGRHLWARTIGSTVVGEAVDSVVFYPLAFYGQWPNALLGKVMVTNYVIKVLVEVLFTPVTYAVVNYLKAAEGEDHFDRTTDFSPLHVKV